MLGQFIQPGSTFVNFGTNYPQPSNVLFPKTLHIPLHTFLNFAPPFRILAPIGSGIPHTSGNLVTRVLITQNVIFARKWATVLPQGYGSILSKTEINMHGSQSNSPPVGFFSVIETRIWLWKSLGHVSIVWKNQTYDAKNKRLKFDWR